MIWLWRYLTGYLSIILCGENAEKIVNVAVKNGINIWDLRYKHGNITGNISIKNFKKLRLAKRGIKCKIKILKKSGIVFRTKKYINRTGFYVGIFLFFALLFLLSNFVWVIKIDGNVNISNTEILTSCKKIGIYEGMNKHNVNTKYDAQRLLLEQNGLAWGSINLEGCVLTVNLSEAVVSDKEERKLPSNIKASFDGKIKKIDVKSGSVSVKVGDTVSKGDLLVSGITENLSSKLFSHSEGVIIAQTQRTYSAEGRYTQTVDSEYKTVTHKSIMFFGLKIPLFLGTVKDEYVYSASVKQLHLFGNAIPIKKATEKYSLIKKEKIKYSETELKNILLKDIENQIKSSDLINYSETDREFICTDNGILLNITYNCEEDIAVQDEILLSN